MTNHCSLRRSSARILAGLLLGIIIAGLSGLGTPAAACACGAVAPQLDVEAPIAGETVVITHDGTTESFHMQLEFEAAALEAGLVVPTPTPATVTEGLPTEAMADLDQATAPETLTRKTYFPNWGVGNAADESAVGNSGVDVIDRVVIGNIEAVTITADDPEGLRDWLDENGYALGDDVMAIIDEYIADGWALAVMKLATDEGLYGDVDSLKFTFETDEMIYPMRLSAASDQAQYVSVYVLGQQRFDHTTGGPAASLRFAGELDPTSVSEAGLRTELEANPYVTAWRYYINGYASQIDDDFRYVPSDGPDYRQKMHVDELVTVWGVPAGIFWLFFLPALIGAVVVVASVIAMGTDLQRRRGRVGDT